MFAILQFFTLLQSVTNQALLRKYLAGSCIEKYPCWDASSGYVLTIGETEINLYSTDGPLLSTFPLYLSTPTVSIGLGINAYYALTGSVNTGITSLVSYSITQGKQQSIVKLSSNVLLERPLKVLPSNIYVHHEEHVLIFSASQLKVQGALSKNLDYLPTSLGVFSVVRNSTHLFLAYQDEIGSTTFWNGSMPFCASKIFLEVNPLDNSCFILCTSNNLITQISSNEGNILRTFLVQPGTIVQMSLSNGFLFFLYKEVRIVQYSVSSDYVGNFSIPDHRLPANPSLKAVNKNIFIALCGNNSNVDTCLNPAIHQYSYSTTIQSTYYFFSPRKENRKPTLYITHKNTEHIINSVTFSEIYQNDQRIAFQNSYFSPISYMSNNFAHFIFYSGGLNPVRGTLGDNHLYKWNFSIDTTRRTFQENSLST
jgi:hypothetical protein